MVGQVKPAVPGEVLTLYPARQEGDQDGASQGRPRRALRVQVQGRAIPAGCACGQARGESRSGGFPRRAQADLGGGLAGRRRERGAEGPAAPARAAQARASPLRSPATTTTRTATRRARVPQDQRLGRDGYASKPVFAKLAPRRGRLQAALSRSRASTWSSTGRARCWCWRTAASPTGPTTPRRARRPRRRSSAPSASTCRRRVRTPRAWSTRPTSSAATRSMATPSVPTYPASHGCLRVPIPNAAQIFNWIDIGDTIHSYQ